MQRREIKQQRLLQHSKFNWARATFEAPITDSSTVGQLDPYPVRLSTRISDAMKSLLYRKGRCLKWMTRKENDAFEDSGLHIQVYRIEWWTDIS